MALAKDLHSRVLESQSILIDHQIISNPIITNHILMTNQVLNITKNH